MSDTGTAIPAGSVVMDPTLFSKNEVARFKGPLQWVAIDVRRDSRFMLRAMRHPRCAEIIACHTLAMMIAASQPIGLRPALLENGKPLDAEALADMTSLSAETWRMAIAFMVETGAASLRGSAQICAEVREPAQTCAGLRESASTGQDRQDKQDNTPPDGGVQGVPLALTPAAAPTSEGFALALESSTAPTPKKPRKPKPAELPLEEWLASLAANPANKGVDVPLLWSKMLMWCEQKQLKPTRNRFMRWLMKEDRTEQQGARKPQHRAEWRIDQDLRETEAELKFLRDQIDYRFGDDLNYLPASLRPRWDRAKERQAALLDELDAVRAATPAPSRPA